MFKPSGALHAEVLAGVYLCSMPAHVASGEQC